MACSDITPQNLFESGAARLGNMYQGAGKQTAPHAWSTVSKLKPITNIGLQRSGPRLARFSRSPDYLADDPVGACCQGESLQANDRTLD